MRFDYRRETDTGQAPVKGGNHSLVHKLAQVHCPQMLRHITDCC